MDLKTRAPELSPQGGPFNASDVGVGPRTRFIAAVHYKDRYLVAYEHGGRGYHVDLLTYAPASRTTPMPVPWRGTWSSRT
jgi:hypothetical protein